MSINSSEVRIYVTYKFNLRLSNFITNSSIHAIFKFLSPIYFELYCDVIRPRLLTAFSVMQHAVKSSPMDVVKSIFGKKIDLRVHGLQARGITLSSFQRCQWKANIPQAVQPVMTFQDL